MSSNGGKRKTYDASHKTCSAHLVRPVMLICVRRAVFRVGPFSRSAVLEHEDQKLRFACPEQLAACVDQT